MYIHIYKGKVNKHLISYVQYGHIPIMDSPHPISTPRPPQAAQHGGPLIEVERGESLMSTFPFGIYDIGYLCR